MFCELKICIYIITSNKSPCSSLTCLDYRRSYNRRSYRYAGMEEVHLKIESSKKIQSLHSGNKV